MHGLYSSGTVDQSEAKPAELHCEISVFRLIFQNSVLREASPLMQRQILLQIVLSQRSHKPSSRKKKKKKRRVFPVVFAIFLLFTFIITVRNSGRQKKRPAMWIIRRLIDTYLYQQLFSARTGPSSRTPETERRTGKLEVGSLELGLGGKDGLDPA